MSQNIHKKYLVAIKSIRIVKLKTWIFLQLWKPDKLTAILHELRQDEIAFKRSWTVHESKYKNLSALKEKYSEILQIGYRALILVFNGRKNFSYWRISSE